MATYRKEKNLVYISIDGKGEYTFDINTGVLYGIRKKPIKTCPSTQAFFGAVRSAYNNMPHGSNLLFVLSNIFKYSNATVYAGYVGAMKVADKIDALNIPNIYLNPSDHEEIDKHFKEFVEYYRQLNGASFIYRDFVKYVKFQEIRPSLGGLADLFTHDMYYSIKEAIDDITIEELGVCAYYLGRGKYWEYHGGNVRNLVNYILYCRCMEKKPQKVNNFMREYCETKQEYELRKTEFDNRKMAMNYAKHRKAWEFEYGDYTIVLPTCGQDIVDEGRNMHHCVGRYVDRVVNGDTYICFVRRKDTPNECYITCQVGTNGNIGQYFLAYDKYISSAEDKAFYNAFKEYLNKVWNEGGQE